MTLHALQIGMDWFTEEPGGLNRVYAHLLSELSRLGIRVEGLVCGTSDVGRASLGLARSVTAPGDRSWQKYSSMRSACGDWMKRHRDDGIVVSHFAQNGFAALGGIRELPFVVHFQGPWALESRAEGGSMPAYRVKHFVESRVYRRADVAITLSHAFARLLEEEFAVAPDRIRVVPGGTEVQRFNIVTTQREARDTLGWHPDRPTVLCVRRLVRRVGLDVLIDAAVELRRRIPDVRVVIAGNGPLRDELAARILAQGLQHTVSLIGFLPDESLPIAYRAADLSVVPTVALEGFGLVTVESLAAGTPCVVTDVGGLSEIMRPLAPHLVVPSRSSGQLAETLAAALLKQTPLPSAAECHVYARDNFDWSVVGERTAAIYHSLRA